MEQFGAVAGLLRSKTSLARIPISARSVVELMGSPRIAARLLPMIARDCAIRPLPQAFTHHATLIWQGSITAMKSNLVF
jgi:hypothetical protein